MISVAGAIESYLAGRTSPSRLECAAVEARNSLMQLDNETRSSWKSPQDVELTQRLKDGQISQEDFAVQWRRLWGYSVADEESIGLVDKVHSCVQDWIGKYLRTIRDEDDDILRLIDSMPWDSAEAVGMRKELSELRTKIREVQSSHGQQ